ncbi:MAG: hypothetical protein ACYTDY_18235, partial [Planctomycetota bacterium]
MTSLSRTLAALVLLGVTLPLPPADAEETPYSRMYFRDIRSKESVLHILRGRATVRRCDTVIVVLDTATFDPPRGTNEFNLDGDFRPDVPGWLDALSTWSTPSEEKTDRPRGVVFYAATTISSRPVRVGEKGWRERIEKRLALEWWDSKAFTRFEPATAWMSRLLGQTPGSRKMLALVTGDILPETWADPSGFGMTPGRWRKKLLPIGKYWNEERIGSLFAEQGAVLDLVAPEARFGDFLPLPDLPELPWASRPVFVRSRTTLPERFGSLTPLWRLYYGRFLFFNTDSPSAFGYWPYARAAAKSGGSYLFYPFPPAKFLDKCPYDPQLLRKLAPEMTTRSAFVKAKAGDRAIQALCEASRLVIGKTPWDDGLHRATGWLGFASTRPLTLTKRFRNRCKPFDWARTGVGTLDAFAAEGRRLAAVLPLYDRALAVLERAARQIREGEVPRPHRRSMANLRLARFWFEMSAFHLKALSLYMTEIEKFAPEEVKERGGLVYIIYAPAIRMSDCLAGYEGRSISLEEEKRLTPSPDARSRMLGAQDNFL